MSTELALVEQFVAQSKMAGGTAAASDVARRACSHGDLNEYGELLDVENMKSLRQSSPKHYKTLELLAFGNCDDLYGHETELLPFDETMMRKLRVSTVIDMTKNSDNGHLSYKSIGERTRLTSDSEIEEMLIDGVYRGQLQCVFDPTVGRSIHVTSCKGRDVRPADYKDIIEQLEVFGKRCDAVLADIQSGVEEAQQSHSNVNKAQVMIEEEHENTKQAAIIQLKNNGGGRTPDDVLATENLPSSSTYRMTKGVRGSVPANKRQASGGFGSRQLAGLADMLKGGVRERSPTKM